MLVSSGNITSPQNVSVKQRVTALFESVLYVAKTKQTNNRSELGLQNPHLDLPLYKLSTGHCLRYL